MASLNLTEDFKEIEKRIDIPEKMLGKGAMMPFNNTNSGSRKIMFGVHLEHRLPLMNPEVPMIQTGYETQFGQYSSCYKQVDQDLTLVARIPKFSFDPYNHYYAIFTSVDGKTIDMMERVEYNHISETYGHLYDNSTIDRLEPSDIIKSGTVIQKSSSFDEYDNRMDGINLLSCYMNIEDTMEDAIQVSESAAKKLASPLIKKIHIIINDNTIPLNLYGTDDTYKIIPDIGEECKNGILCAVRQEKKEETLYSQSCAKLKEVMMSDEKYMLVGKVIDVNVYCNAPDKLNESKNMFQINMYYKEAVRMYTEIVDTVLPLLNKGMVMTLEMQKLYYTAVDVLAGKQYMDDRVFTNTVLEVIVMEESVLHEGDKLSNRYGGKGVISKIVPDNEMPMSDNGEFVELIFNSLGVPNRVNAGQLFESSINFIGRRIVEAMQIECFDVSQCVEIYLKFLYMLSDKLGSSFEAYLSKMDDEELVNYISSICDERGIYLSIEPMSESMTIDKLSAIYDEFSWVKLDNIVVPLRASDGQYRYVKARRPIVVARQYIYRLKQYAEEKFSVTSLSSTNIRNENSRNKQKNNYRALFPKTPIRFGEMESGDLIHLGSELVSQVLMIYSTSPHGRRLTEQMLTGDPFNVDIKLDAAARSRSAEMFNVYFKAMGLRLKFIRKKKKKIIPILIEPVEFFFADRKLINPIMPYHKGERFDTYFAKLIKDSKKKKHLYPVAIEPVEFFTDDVDLPEA